jgi:hypothetical protein
LSSINAVKDSSPCNHDSGGASPNTHSGKNSPNHRTSCNKVNKLCHRYSTVLRIAVSMGKVQIY